MMRSLSCFFILLLLLPACSSPNMLLYKYCRHYHESNSIGNDTVFTLYQCINYYAPHVVDEEHAYELTFAFKDTAAAIAKKKLNLASDTAIVKASYDFTSVWYGPDHDAIVTGNIEILDWNKNKVVLKEHVKVEDARKKTRYYRGTRRFKR